MGKEKDIDEAVRTLKREGYRLRKPGTYKKTSVVVHEPTWKVFKSRAESLDYLVQEALTEAIELWLELRRND